MPHHSCYSCASSGEDRAPAAGTNHAPPGDRAPPGEDRALAAGTNHAPLENRQAPAVDEGPFLPRTQCSSANPDGGWNTYPDGG